MRLLVLASLLLAVPTLAADKPRVSPPAPATVGIDVAGLHALKARAIGPAIMGGRVTEIALDPVDPFTFYVGLATGGIEKTTDDGLTFTPLFDKQAVSSIGALAVAPSDAKVVWVGTGEGTDRNSAGYGDGVYRSTDAGSTWTNVGLRATRAIGRIAVHPKDPQIAYVAALGNLWQAGGERGLYKTSDGGAHWKLVLEAPAPFADRVGAGDVVLDPSNPDVVYATLYARRRTPWSFTSGATLTDGRDVGGIFKSTDAGATWTRLSGGLPARTGRIGLTLAASKPATLYAVVQSDEAGSEGIGDLRAKSGGIFRSDDGGATWARRSPLTPRPFYFSEIRVSPDDPETVYVLGFGLHVSQDGGRSFREDRFGKVHPDLHALAIDLRHAKRLLLGTDGGVYRTVNGGEGWEHLARFPAGEYYRITLDDSDPYRICGGLQDNQNWLGPSRTWNDNGIVNEDWQDLGGGDGFSCVFDPTSRDVLYAESQNGSLFRLDLGNGDARELRPAPAEGQPALRFAWNSPLLGSVHTKGVLYLAGDRVYRLTDRGERFTVISGPLSAPPAERLAASGSGAETHGVATTMAESPKQVGQLWVGTDDGRLWRTDDDGATWTDLSDKLPLPARGHWISRVEASPHDAAVAYVSVEAYRDGNDAPLVFRTSDRGRTWEAISGDLPRDAPVRVVREDPVNPRLLYAGTETGLFASLDRGTHWVRLGDLPTVAVHDIQVHAREHDLVIATHGRSLYVIDDIRALQELTEEAAAADAWLFPPRAARGRELLPGSATWAGAGAFRGENPPAGALITYHVRAWTGDPVKIAIEDAAGIPVAKLTAPGTPGFGRVSWDLKPSKELLSEYRGEGRLFVRSGTYTVTLTHGATKQKQSLVVQIPEGVQTR